MSRRRTRARFVVLVPFTSALLLLSAAVPAADPKPVRSPAGADTRPATRPYERAPATQPASIAFQDIGAAKRVVFVCDGTGSMLNVMTKVQRDLQRAIHGLAEGTQEYKVIVFTGKSPVLTDPSKGLLSPSPANKKATGAWLDELVPVGVTDPISAVRAAFALKPDLVYFVTDGEMGDRRLMTNLAAETVRLARASKGARVNTVLVESIEPESAKVLADIAKQTGGTYLAVRRSDLAGETRPEAQPPNAIPNPGVNGGRIEQPPLATRPASVVFQDLGNAKRVVFVGDATGTMINKIAVMRKELARAVGELADGTHEFKVVLYTDTGRVLTDPSKKLLAATDANKKATGAWLEGVVAAGTTDPLPALRAAFALKPDLVYFLSDGEFNNLRTYKEVQGEVLRLAKGVKGCRVNTILFDTIDPEAKKVLTDIAKQTGGTYREVRAADLAAN